MFRGLTKFIQRKRAQRKARVKGSAAKAFHRKGRNTARGVTAVDLWRSRFRFTETPAAKAGSARRSKRERAERRAKNKSWLW